MKKDKYLLATLAINNLSAYTINNLSADTIKKLGKDAIAKHNEFWDSIPVIPKFYTHLLKDINKKKRIHSQSTWGSIEDFDPEANVCGTPMCTAQVIG